MQRYNPEQEPPADEWLALDEGRRLDLVEIFHRDERISLRQEARLAHASIHVVVENQLALKREPIVRALLRLMKQGLSRHDAVHAIGSVLGETVHDAMTTEETGETLNARYYAAVERLSAQSWNKSG